jgi:hypothetical protein
MLSTPLSETYPADFSFGGYPLTWVRTFQVNEEGASVTKSEWVTAQGGNREAFSWGDGFAIWLNADNEAGYPQDPDKGLKKLSGIHELPFFEHLAATADPAKRTLYQVVNQTHTYDDATQASTFYNFSIIGGQIVPLSGNGNEYDAPRSNLAYELMPYASCEKSLSFAAGSVFALIGNPFMAALDFNKLIGGGSNGSLKPLYYVYDGSGYATYSHEGYSGPGSNEDVNYRYIAPLQGFIVEKVDVSVNVPDIAFDEDEMTVLSPAVLRSSDNQANKLNIVARTPDAAFRAFIAKREYGQESYGKHDARKLIHEVSAAPEIYTLKPDKNRLIAVGGNIINSDEQLIPLGLLTSYAGDITLSFTGMDTYNAQISLFDATLGKEIDFSGKLSFEYTIDNYKPRIVNEKPVACEDRFFIRISKSVTGLEESIAGKVIVYESNGLIQVVSTASNPIKEVAVYDLQGVLVYKASVRNEISHTVNMNRPAGAYIVKVVSEKGVNNVKVVTSNK